MARDGLSYHNHQRKKTMELKTISVPNQLADLIEDAANLSAAAASSEKNRLPGLIVARVEENHTALATINTSIQDIYHTELTLDKYLYKHSSNQMTPITVLANQNRMLFRKGFLLGVTVGAGVVAIVAGLSIVLSIT